MSARRRHYYAHPGNSFWKALSASALVGEELGPEDDRSLASRYGIGFTDVVKRVVTNSSEVTDGELRAALPAFRARTAYARPRVVCFTTTRGFHACFPGVRAASDWGRQPVTLASRGSTDSEVWVMPSTSGRAAAHRVHVYRVLEELAERLTALRENIAP
jgi:TDG/mug DNA glycosylase family protein